MLIKSDKEYNEMWEHAVLLMTRDMLSNITPAHSSVVPAGEILQMKNQIQNWINKLEIIVKQDEEEGRVCTAKHSK